MITPEEMAHEAKHSVSRIAYPADGVFNAVLYYTTLMQDRIEALQDALRDALEVLDDTLPDTEITVRLRAILEDSEK